MDDPPGIPGLVNSSGDSSDKVGFHTFGIDPSQLQELISEYSSEASIEEEEKQPELRNLTDGSSEEEECPILEEPQKLGPLGGFSFTSPAVKVRGILLEYNLATQHLLRSWCIWGCSSSDLSTFVRDTKKLSSSVLV